jgi:hypothetical protein
MSAFEQLPANEDRSATKIDRQSGIRSSALHSLHPRDWRRRMHMSAKQHAHAACCGTPVNYATGGGPTYCIAYRANTSASIFGPFGTAKT